MRPNSLNPLSPYADLSSDSAFAFDREQTMFGVVGPKDFLAQCYQFSDLLAVAGQFIAQFLVLFGIAVPDVRAACLAIYTAIGGT